jgi:hypothetical protein
MMVLPDASPCSPSAHCLCRSLGAPPYGRRRRHVYAPCTLHRCPQSLLACSLYSFATLSLSYMSSLAALSVNTSYSGHVCRGLAGLTQPLSPNSAVRHVPAAWTERAFPGTCYSLPPWPAISDIEASSASAVVKPCGQPFSNTAP